LTRYDWCALRERRRIPGRLGEILLLLVTFAAALLLPRVAGSGARLPTYAEQSPVQNYLGFDANDYPGDDALPALRRTFTFSGYWLNVPPGAKTNTWTGKRATLLKNHFGFLILFNGRLSRELRPPADPGDLGARDAETAVAAAQREGFSSRASTVIYLDIEEGGRMYPSQINYLQGWSERVAARGFAAGVYCSAIQVKEADGQTITTADDIQERAPMAGYFVYNDACPPSPGCTYWKNPPSPSASGFSGALVWQFAQSPRRGNLTGPCRATYDSDGNCYPPVGTAAGRLQLDLDSSLSPDPSGAAIPAVN
jgi:Domain of unknown function (DUF1906)